MGSLVPSGERGDRGIGDDGGIRDDRSIIDDKKLDISTSIIECKIKQSGSSGTHGDDGTAGVSTGCSVIQGGTGMWGKSRRRLNVGTYTPTLEISNHPKIPNKEINAKGDLPWEFT